MWSFSNVQATPSLKPGVRIWFSGNIVRKKSLDESPLSMPKCPCGFYFCGFICWCEGSWENNSMYLKGCMCVKIGFKYGSQYMITEFWRRSRSKEVLCSSYSFSETINCSSIQRFGLFYLSFSLLSFHFFILSHRFERKISFPLINSEKYEHTYTGFKPRHRNVICFCFVYTEIHHGLAEFWHGPLGPTVLMPCHARPRLNLLHEVT